MKFSVYSSFLIALCGFFLAHASPLMGQATTETKVKKIPFHGKLLSVDQGAQSITIAGKTPRVFHLTPTTKITDGTGAPSSLAAAVVGEDVGGSYSKDATGTMTLFSVRFGAKTGSKAAAETPAATTAPMAAAPPAAPEAAPTPAPAMTAPAPAAATTATTKPKKQTFSGTVGFRRRPPPIRWSCMARRTRPSR